MYSNIGRFGLNADMLELFCNNDAAMLLDTKKKISLERQSTVKTKNIPK